MMDVDGVEDQMEWVDEEDEMPSKRAK
jgi:hypothetical protein